MKESEVEWLLGINKFDFFGKRTQTQIHIRFYRVTKVGEREQNCPFGFGMSLLFYFYFCYNIRMPLGIFLYHFGSQDKNTKMELCSSRNDNFLIIVYFLEMLFYNFSILFYHQFFQSKREFLQTTKSGLPMVSMSEADVEIYSGDYINSFFSFGIYQLLHIFFLVVTF